LTFKVIKEARTISIYTVVFLFQVCSKKIPDVTTDQVKMKINTLRSNFRREVVKMKKIASGGSTEDAHDPTLWYYSQMMFIANQETPLPSISTISEDENDEEKDEENENQVSTFFICSYACIQIRRERILPPPISSQCP
jgi:hypothetical protein